MEKSLPTHAVKAVIKNAQGEVLFLQRAGQSRADGKTNWDLPGGLVEPGEDDDAALAREVDEELHTKAAVRQEIGKWTFFRPYDDQTVEVTNYEVTIGVSDASQLMLSHEHTAAKFFNQESLRELDVKDPSIFAALGI